jgi:outer membrane protein OmpA-like peptidoglycan-associated protein
VKYKTNPQLLKGAVLRGVRLGGDIDIALKFAGDNGVPVNQDEKLYDPNALNLSYGSDFLSVVNDYNANQKETRKIVRNGKTGADTTVGFDLVATWTPGDVNAIVGAEGVTPRGGATIISTRQYTSIMPAVMISCRKFLNDNTSKIQDMLAALAQAGDQVRSFEDVKEYALGLDAKMWNEKDQAYWTKYYNGLQNGNAHLGGSMVYNLKDVANEFGLQGTSDIYKEVYNTFKDIHGRLYGKELAGVADYGKAVDKSFMAAVVANHPELLEGKALATQYAANITTKVASKNVQINFETGSAKISPSSFATLDDIYTNAVSAEGLKVGVYGYTDNVGSPDKNQTLSEARAESVKQYLLSKGLSANRIESKGYGQQQPVADNSTADGRAKNRRVEIALGN